MINLNIFSKFQANILLLAIFHDFMWAVDAADILPICPYILKTHPWTLT